MFRGSNQRLEFLGDTVLQLIASEYLYKYFPEHHEGHLSVSIIFSREWYIVFYKYVIIPIECLLFVAVAKELSCE